MKKGVGVFLALMVVSCHGMHRMGRLALVVRSQCNTSIRRYSTAQGFPLELLKKGYEAWKQRHVVLTDQHHDRLRFLTMLIGQNDAPTMLESPLITSIIENLATDKKELTRAQDMVTDLHKQIQELEK